MELSKKAHTSPFFSLTHTHTTHTQQNSHSTWLRKDVGMYVHHEVSSCGVLHDKTHMFWRLETCKQVDQEGVVGAVDGLKDPLLTHQTGDRQRGAEGGAYETVITVRGVIMRWMSFVVKLRLEVEVTALCTFTFPLHPSRRYLPSSGL